MTGVNVDRVELPRSLPEGRLRRVALDYLLIALVPLIAWPLFGYVLINQDGFVDPWIYVGYGRNFRALHAMFGWPYYSVRFPVIMLNDLFLAGDPIAGHALLRYCLVLLCGVPLYAWAARAFGRLPAAIAFLFLVCNPLLGRVILWNYTTFASIPFALAGMATWLWSDRFAARALSGFLFMAALASHAFTGSALLFFVAVQLVWRLWAREIGALVLRDLIATGLGAAACLALGFTFYYSQVGPFDPRVIYQATASAAAAGHEYAREYQRPFALWAAIDYHIYVPVVCVAVCGVLLGRRLFSRSAESSVWWFAATYTTFYYVYQFVMGRFVLETFYYFGHLTLAVFVLIPLIVSELTRRLERRAAVITAAAALVALLLLPIYNRLDAMAVVQYVVLVADSRTALVTFAALALAICVLCVRPKAVTAGVALVGFLLLVQSLTVFSRTQYSVLERGPRVAREASVLRAAVEMVDVFGQYSRPESPVMLWYCADELSVQSMASAVLLFTMHNPFVPQSGCASHIGEYEHGRLTDYKVRYVMVLDESGDSTPARLDALRKEGYQTRQLLVRTVGDTTFHPTLRVIELTSSARIE